MEEAMKILASFLGGGLFATLVFVFTFYSKISALTEAMSNLTKLVDAHLKSHPPCPFHTSIATDVGILKAESRNFKE